MRRFWGAFCRERAQPPGWRSGLYLNPRDPFIAPSSRGSQVQLDPVDRNKRQIRSERIEARRYLHQRHRFERAHRRQFKRSPRMCIRGYAPEQAAGGRFKPAQHLLLHPVGHRPNQQVAAKT